MKALLFDLGGVLINLDVARTERAFADLVGNDTLHAQLKAELDAELFFERYEMGKITDKAFVERLQDMNPKRPSREAVETAWSAMLLDFPAERLTMLRELRQAGHPLYVLSNTNALHVAEARRIVQRAHGAEENYENYFDKVFYSHEMGYRKPMPAIYEAVLADRGLKAEEVLFIDDNAENIESARRVGLDAHLHEANGDIAAFVKQLLARS